jgi:PAS domain S-box-containing protein
VGERQAPKRATTFESASFKVAERDYRILIDSIADYAIFMIGPDGRVETWNSGAAALHGYAPDEIVGERLAALHTEEDRAAGEPARKVALAQAEGRAESEGWRVRKDGSRFWASSILTALWDGPRLLGFAEVTRDLTARRAADEATRASLARAEELLRDAQRTESIGMLSSAVAHDFNNSLSVVLTYCDLLVNDLGLASGPGDDVVEIQKAAARMARMTQQLLTFSKRRSSGSQPFDLSDLVAGVEGVVRRIAGDAIRVTCDLQRPLGVTADRLSIEQGLLALVSNARDAMPAGGTLAITTSTEPVETDLGRGSYGVVTVTDTGTGMDDATLARCFEPFFTTKRDGTGAGLATVLATARQSGGHVRIQSTPGAGTTVKLYLPSR